MAFGRKRKGQKYTASVAAARTGDAALDAMIRDQNASDERETAIRSDVFKMIDQGTGTIVDLWAPPRMKILSDYIELGNEALAICTISNWPTRLSYGWLNQLLEDPSLSDVKIDVSMHIHPIRKEYALQYMRDKKVSAESSKMAEQGKGKKGTTALAAYSKQIDTASMIYRLLEDNDSENLFQVSITFGIYGQEDIQTDPETQERYVHKDAKEDVIEKMDRFKRALAKNSGGGFAVKPLLHQQRDGIKSLLPFGYGGLHSFQNMYTSALATCYPFTHGELSVENGILYGINPYTKQTYFFDSFNRDWVNNYSTIVIGGSGFGKSATVKTLLGRYAIHGTQVFVIDPAMSAEGEYTNLATSLDGTVIEFGGRNGVYMNPFELVRPGKWEPGMPTNQEEASTIYRTKKEYLVGLFDLMRKKYIEENQIVGKNLDAFSSVVQTMIDRVYQVKRISIQRGRWNYAQWEQSSMPTMSDFHAMLVEQCKLVETRNTREKIEAWGADHLSGGRLKRDTPEEITMFLYYLAVVRGSDKRVWKEPELAVLTFMRDFVAEYARKTDDDTYSEKAALFSGRRQADISSNCIVFRFGEIANSLKDIATYLTFELIYSRINSSQSDNARFSHYIVAMDECWKLLTTRYTHGYIMRLAREGRKLNTGVWVISQRYTDFQGDNRTLFTQADTKIILALPQDEIDLLTDDIDLSPSLAQVINADCGHTSPGVGVLNVAGKRHASVAFYCCMSQMELAIADTSDATRKALTPQQIMDFVR